ncbi:MULTISPECIES: YqjF family protein [unclassified Chryseobacterium]|uniref:YqjF family protein n=1 Tax=unclassified Chryseobacterium TaxID=2593645 RepID=UPI00301830D7
MNFLKAEWRKLAIINYEIKPEILQKYLPKGTELDFYKGKCYVSVVGFMFLNTKLLGLPIPFHRNFEEVNLRFYVKKKEGYDWKRGVVFIKEIVPKPALSFVANSVYKENYKTMPMKNIIHQKDRELLIKYSWKDKEWHSIEISAESEPLKMENNSEFEFITEHYYGFTKKENKTSEYQVCHPKWDYYLVKNYQLKINFQKVYGNDFECLNHRKPISVMLAEGSEIEVKTKKYLI